MADRVRIMTHLPEAENLKKVVRKEKVLSNRPALGDIRNKVSNNAKVDTLPLKAAVTQLSTRCGDNLKSPSKPTTLKEETKRDVKPIKAKNLKKQDSLPPNVENIDADDSENPFLLPEYVNDIYDYLRSLEVKYPITKNFLADSNISSRMRAILIDWLVEVQVQYHLLLETLHITVGILDQYLERVKVIPKDKLQLVGITAMFIASKYEEACPPELNDFIYVSDSAYTSDEILRMERKVLEKLQFNLSRPISLVFLRRYSKAAKVQAVHHAFGKYFLELALLEYSLGHIKPSLLAATALFIALCVVGNDIKAGLAAWTPTVAYFSKYTIPDILPIIPVLANVIKQSHKSKFQAIQRKYFTTKQLEISSKNCIAEDSPILNKLCRL